MERDPDYRDRARRDMRDTLKKQIRHLQIEYGLFRPLKEEGE